jgi:hypothetical protein
MPGLGAVEVDDVDQPSAVGVELLRLPDRVVGEDRLLRVVPLNEVDAQAARMSTAGTMSMNQAEVWLLAMATI